MLIVKRAKDLIKRKKPSILIKKKANPADSQPNILIKTNILCFSQNPQKTKKNYCNQKSGYVAVGTRTTYTHLVDTTSNNNSGAG